MKDELVEIIQTIAITVLLLLISFLIVIIAIRANEEPIVPDTVSEVYELNIAGTNRYLYIIQCDYVFLTKDEAEKFIKEIKE